MEPAQVSVMPNPGLMNEFGAPYCANMRVSWSHVSTTLDSPPDSNARRDESSKLGRGSSVAFNLLTKFARKKLGAKVVVTYAY